MTRSRPPSSVEFSTLFFTGSLIGVTFTLRLFTLSINLDSDHTSVIIPCQVLGSGSYTWKCQNGFIFVFNMHFDDNI